MDNVVDMIVPTLERIQAELVELRSETSSLRNEVTALRDELHSALHRLDSRIAGLSQIMITTLVDLSARNHDLTPHPTP